MTHKRIMIIQEKIGTFIFNPLKLSRLEILGKFDILICYNKRIILQASLAEKLYMANSPIEST